MHLVLALILHQQQHLQVRWRRVQRCASTMDGFTMWTKNFTMAAWRFATVEAIYAWTAPSSSVHTTSIITSASALSGMWTQPFNRLHPIVAHHQNAKKVLCFVQILESRRVRCTAVFSGVCQYGTVVLWWVQISDALCFPQFIHSSLHCIVALKFLNCTKAFIRNQVECRVHDCLSRGKAH